MSDSFYADFEEKHRGSRELIKKRLTVYQPFLEQLCSTSFNANAIDLGCGRGEWLEFVSSLGFIASGVDIDAGMLLACNQLGLSVEQKDLLEYLQSLESESVSLVSAFHVVEHIPFDAIRTVVKESLRVLKPGGILIMETPNPENITVSTHLFYMDPTHQNPIPPELLAFVTNHAGFKRSRILRAQESQALTNSQDASLKDVFFGVSPDYAIVAQKDAEPEVLKKFTPLFQKQYGLSLEDLLDRWEKGYAKLQHTISRGERRENVWEDHDKTTDLLLLKIQELEEKSFELERVRIHSHLINKEKLAAENRARHLNQQLLAIKQSTSWRITWPMRLLKSVLPHLFGARNDRLKNNIFINTLRKVARYSLAKAISVTKKNKSLESTVLKVLSQYPQLKAHLRAFERNRGIDMSRPTRKTENSLTIQSPMTPRGQKLYSAIKTAIAQNNN